MCQVGNFERREKENCQLENRMQPADLINRELNFSMGEGASYHKGETETERTVVRCSLVRKVSKRPK